MAIKFENVSFSYEDKLVLDNISFEIEENTITGICGKSGSGKTTLIELMNALLRPNSGTISVLDYEIRKDNEIENIDNLRFNVGMVFQFPEEQFFKSTVAEEIGFGIDKFRYRSAQKEKRIIDALYMVGLDKSYLKQNPFTLSNGEKRKVAIASILVFNPKIIILDEPTIGLDMSTTKELVKLIKLLKTRYDKTVIVVSHDTDFLHSVVDNVIILNRGDVVMNGDKYSVFKDPKNLKKYGLSAPKLMEIPSLVYAHKKIKIGYRDEIDDLIKDIYRYVK